MNGQISVFLSHSSNDKIIANDLKNDLKSYNIDLFLAHVDIEGGEDWAQTLYEEIEKCDIFMVLLSKQYHDGKYTDQEIGMSIAHDKNIIPISIDGTKPYGFISKIQSMNIYNDMSGINIQQIAELITSKSKARISIIDITIESLTNSKSWEEAGIWAQRLLRYTKFSQTQISMIADAYIDNDQIHNSFAARNKIKKIIINHKELLNEHQRSWFGL